jgi:hypothetical protein
VSRVVVNGTGIPTAETAGPGTNRPLNPLDGFISGLMANAGGGARPAPARQARPPRKKEPTPGPTYAPKKSDHEPHIDEEFEGDYPFTNFKDYLEALKGILKDIGSVFDWLFPPPASSSPHYPPATPSPAPGGPGSGAPQPTPTGPPAPGGG